MLPSTSDGSARAHVFSASQISTYLECKRKWAWQYIAKEPRTQHASAALGVRVHKQLELWLKEGRPLQYALEDGRPDDSASIAKEALEHLPPPMLPGLDVEGYFNFTSPRSGLAYRGFIDWRHPHWPGDIPTIGDHKTTSGLQWAKSATDLDTDVQATLYAVDTMAHYRAPRVRLQWTYLQTRGARRSLPVVTELSSPHVAEMFAAVEEVAAEMSTTLHRVTDKLQILELPPSPQACESFGGCPFQGQCNLSPRERLKAVLAHGLTCDSTLKSRLQEKRKSSGSGIAAIERSAPLLQSAGESETPQDRKRSKIPEFLQNGGDSSSTDLPQRCIESESSFNRVSAQSVAKLSTPSSRTSTIATQQGLLEGCSVQVAMSESETSKRQSVSSIQPSVISGDKAVMSQGLVPVNPLLARLKARAAATSDAPTAGMVVQTAFGPGVIEPGNEPTAEQEAARQAALSAATALRQETPSNADPLVTLGVLLPALSSAAMAATVSPGQINPPEFQPAPTVVQRAETPIQTTIAQPARRGPGRPKKATPAPLEGQPMQDPANSLARLVHAAPTPSTVAEGLVDGPSPVESTPRGRIPVLYIDCFPLNGDVLLADNLAKTANDRIKAEKGVADYRYLEYGAGPGALAATAEEILDGMVSIPRICIDTHSPEGCALLSRFKVRAVEIVQSTR